MTQEKIEQYLESKGYKPLYTPKRWNIRVERHHGRYKGYIKIIKSMDDAVKFVESDKE